VDAGLKDELVFGDPEAPRFVFWEGRLRPVPGGPAVRRVLRRSVRVTRVDPPAPGARIEHVTVTNMQGTAVRRRIVMSTLAEDWHSRFTQQLPQEKTNHGAVF
jgi:hypothetical protein